MTEGKCLCGGVSVTLRGRPSTVGACHCTSCRRATGAPMAVYIDMPTASVHLTGQTLSQYTSAPGVIRSFCSRCGASIAYQGDNLPDMIHLHIGLFDAPNDFAPQSNENAETQYAWLKVAVV